MVKDLGGPDIPAIGFAAGPSASSSRARSRSRPRSWTSSSHRSGPGTGAYRLVVGRDLRRAGAPLRGRHAQRSHESAPPPRREPRRPSRHHPRRLRARRERRGREGPRRAHGTRSRADVVTRVAAILASAAPSPRRHETRAAVRSRSRSARRTPSPRSSAAAAVARTRRPPVAPTKNRNVGPQRRRRRRRRSTGAGPPPPHTPLRRAHRPAPERSARGAEASRRRSVATKRRSRLRSPKASRSARTSRTTRTGRPTTASHDPAAIYLEHARARSADRRGHREHGHGMAHRRDLLFYQRRSPRWDADVFFPAVWRVRPREQGAHRRAVPPPRGAAGARQLARAALFQAKLQGTAATFTRCRSDELHWNEVRVHDRGAMLPRSNAARRRHGRRPVLVPRRQRRPRRRQGRPHPAGPLFPPRARDRRELVHGGRARHLETDPKRSIFDVAPFFFSIRGKPETGGVKEAHASSALPLRHEARRTSSSSPGYIRRVTPTADTMITPFFSRARRGKGLDVAHRRRPDPADLPQQRRRGRGLRRPRHLPFYFRLVEARRDRRSPPLYGTVESYNVTRTHWVFPNITYTRDTDGWETDVHPLVYPGAARDSSHTVVAPIFWDFASPKEPHHGRLPRSTGASPTRAARSPRSPATRLTRAPGLGRHGLAVPPPPAVLLWREPAGYWWNVLFSLARLEGRGDELLRRCGCHSGGAGRKPPSSHASHSHAGSSLSGWIGRGNQRKTPSLFQTRRRNSRAVGSLRRTQTSNCVSEPVQSVGQVRSGGIPPRAILAGSDWPAGCTPSSSSDLRRRKNHESLARCRSRCHAPSLGLACTTDRTEILSQPRPCGRTRREAPVRSTPQKVSDSPDLNFPVPAAADVLI